ncbi:hypothetical protein ACM64Y_11010 [Novispirillum sp. DQ9]|uniref:hypothetical protein n=1 Tax=Novispirillum sp. DQ9 TaxID=3398612 RepID=UPI003C7E236C
MTKLRQTKTNFTAGELTPELLGRGDLTAYENGAARLRNVFIQPTGGVQRRAGLGFIGAASGPGRLISFEFNSEQVYLLVLTHLKLTVYLGGAAVATLTTPWTHAHLAEIDWTQSADTLLIVHPDVEPQRITRTSHSAWTIEPWTYDGTGLHSTRPWTQFGPQPVKMIVYTHFEIPEVRSDKSYFNAKHIGVTMRVGGALLTLTDQVNSTRMRCSITGTCPVGQYTSDWAEPAFSPARGWPSSVTFHQDRLVVGGARSLPNHLWMSRSGRFFNFDVGTGLDDEAMHFEILSDQVDAIRHVFSGRHLQVFTTGGEWMVSGEPLAPRTVQLHRQTRIGARTGARVPPRDVDGATLFAAASGRELREFLFTDAENAYQAADLALLGRHLVADPVDMDYDPVRRLVHVVMADGSLATVTNFRREKVTAWTRQETPGRFLAVSVVGTETYVLVDRNGFFGIEVLADDLTTDSALTGAAATPKVTWSGLGHLNGRTVKVKADGVEVDDAVVSGGAITLATAASIVEAGLPFSHVVEPLPPLPEGPNGGGNGRQMRLVRASFRVLATPVLQVDTGRGPTAASFKRFGASGVLDAPPPAFTGDVTVRALGWQRDAVRPLWRVEQDSPHPCCILSVTTETKVTD